MSLNIVAILPDRALIATDTQAERDGALFETTKLFVLPHASACMTGRGALDVLTGAYERLLAMAAGFDLMAGAMPVLLASVAATGFARAEAAGSHMGAFHGAQEVVLVGWSDVHAGMRGIVFTQHRPGAAFQPTPIWTAHVAPWDVTQGPVPQLVDLVGIRDASAAIGAFHARFRGPSPVGGRLTVTELTHGSIAITTHPLPHPTVQE